MALWKKEWIYVNANRRVVYLLATLIALAILIGFSTSGCGGGGGSTAATTTTVPGTQPTGIPGAPVLNTALPAYASTTASLSTSWSVDGYSKDCYVNGVQKAGPNNISTTLTVTDALTEGNNVFSMLCKNAAGTPGPSKDYSIVLDTVAPGAPVLASAISTTTNANSISISIEKSLDWLVESRVNSGTWMQVLQRDTFTDVNFDTKVVHDYVQSLVSGLNSIQIRATDRAGNVGTAYLPLSITSSTTGGTGGGTTNPGAPTISCSYSANALILTTTCTISGTGATSASMSWGDGSANTDLTTGGGTYSHTYAGAGTFTTVATVNAAGGSNTYTQSVTVNTTGGGAIGSYYAATSWSATLDDFDRYNNDLIGIKDAPSNNATGWCLYKYENGATANNCVTPTNIPVVLQTPTVIATCSNNGRVGIFDRGWNQIFVFTYTNPDFVRRFDVPGLGSDIWMSCDNDGNFIIADSSLNKVIKYSGSGTLQWTYSSVSNPTDVSFDSANNIYIADEGNDRIVKLLPNGTLSTSWGTNGTGDGQFTNLNSVDVNPNNEVFALDGSRIQKFNASGGFLGKFSFSSTTPVKIRTTGVDTNNRVYLLDTGANTITKFAPN